MTIPNVCPWCRASVDADVLVPSNPPCACRHALDDHESPDDDRPAGPCFWNGCPCRRFAPLDPAWAGPLGLLE